MRTKRRPARRGTAPICESLELRELMAAPEFFRPAAPALMTGGRAGTASLTVFPQRGVYLARLDLLSFDHVVLTTRDGTAANQMGVDTFLKLFDASGNIVPMGSDDNGNGGVKSKIDTFIANGGTYYVGASTAANSDYTFTRTSLSEPSSTNVFFLDALVERATSNKLPDRASSATVGFTLAVNDNQGITTRITSGVGGFITINASPLTPYQITTSLPERGGFPGKTVATVYDPNGRRVTGMRDDASFYDRIRFTAPTAGKYHIYIGSTKGPNTITVNDPSSITPVGWSETSSNGEYSGRGPIDSGSDFKFDIMRLPKTSPADFDADGKTDVAVYGYTRLAYLPSRGGPQVVIPYGGTEDRFVSGDFDADGKTDVAVYGYTRLAYLPSSGGPQVVIPYGGTEDRFVSGDFDGDGKTDVAVYGYTRLAYLPSSGGPQVVTSYGGPADTFVTLSNRGSGTAAGTSASGTSAPNSGPAGRSVPPAMRATATSTRRSNANATTTVRPRPNQFAVHDNALDLLGRPMA